jgi:hypothetical protein
MRNSQTLLLTTSVTAARKSIFKPTLKNMLSMSVHVSPPSRDRRVSKLPTSCGAVRPPDSDAGSHDDTFLFSANAIR